jgi:hypothetical protein
MRRLRLVSVAAALLLVLLASACGEVTSPQATAASASTATTITAKVVTADDFDPDKFSDPTSIDNQWFPLKPGTQLTYEGSAIEDDGKIARKVVFTVTDLTKTINGVRTLVAWDRDYNDGQLVEPELVFFAQDDDGNVWTLGQYPEEYEDGKFVAAPAWLAGLEGAKAGLVMRAAPKPGTSDYSQGLGPKVEYADRAKVGKVGQRTCVPPGCYQDVLITEEWDAADPAARQLKYYAPGVGNVRVGWTGRDEEKEVLVLSKMVQLSPAALAEVRTQVLKLERRAYKVSKAVYAHTPPAEQLPG